MTNTPGGNGFADTPEEELTVLMALMGASGVIVGALAVFWDKVVAWLLEHEVLIAASANPLVAIPGTEGAGLDLMRVIVGVGIVLALVAVLGSILGRAVRRRRHARENA